ncbi:MAG TPA: MFS transporter [Lacipirellulaceae bacterium]|nr:MFS transporter [Lacipirellulaceae bacterium]
MPRRAAVDPISALRHGGFLLYLVAGLVSNSGSQMRIVAVQWEMVLREPDRGKLALLLAYIGLALVLPVILFALPAGAAADRFSRRWLVMIAQLGLAVCGVGLAWASWTQAPLLLVYFLLFGTGAFRALGWPASSAIVTGLVPAKVFSNAATWRSNAYQLASVVGPLVGGLLLKWWTPATVLLIDAASSLILAACMLFVRPRPQERVIEPHSWKSLLQGIRFLRKQPIILSTMTLDMVAVLFGGVVALLPIFARQFFTDPDQAAVALGWMRAMPALGSILMGFILALRPPIQRGGRTILVTVTTFGLATIVFGLSTSFALSLAALFILGAADNISVVIRQTVLQLLTPDSMRGRVTAVSVIFIGSSNELGEFESGIAAYLMGLVPSVVFGGVMSIVAVGIVAAIWPQLLRLGALDQLTPPEPLEVVV